MSSGLREITECLLPVCQETCEWRTTINIISRKKLSSLLKSRDFQSLFSVHILVLRAYIYIYINQNMYLNKYIMYIFVNYSSVAKLSCNFHQKRRSKAWESAMGLCSGYWNEMLGKKQVTRTTQQAIYGRQYAVLWVHMKKERATMDD